MKKVIVIVGPTASGKTKLSIELAKKLDGEIVSCDSMQIYKYMDIGTAKPMIQEMNGIKHHMIDIVLPSEEFSVAKYKDMAKRCIEDILKRGKMPIVVGGTGLYANALIYNLSFKDTVCDWEYRRKLEKEAKLHGNKYLHDKLKDIDRESYEKLHENDLKRIIRALEVYKFTGSTITQQSRMSRINPPEYQYVVFGLTMDREKLYERINKRVDIMIESGLIEEVKNIVRLGYKNTRTASCAIGYKEIFAWLDGKCTYQEAIDKLKMESRRYAKRQITWFKRVENIHMVDASEDIEDILGYMENIISF
ncbi:MAG: tRNA (adenosine(37)-N6)-dimethylallyltransferase MiaA [Clostridiales bacterium]|nr:tRNA (adenosine(37)-N6)-dimethylallyltransferase MiaA [Clostridiales bacterium]